METCENCTNQYCEIRNDCKVGCDYIQLDNWNLILINFAKGYKELCEDINDNKMTIEQVREKYHKGAIQEGANDNFWVGYFMAIEDYEAKRTINNENEILYEALAEELRRIL